MDFQDLCPNCSCDLNNQKNVLLTDESAIFKGHNVYMLCKNCGYVMVYNKDRNFIFNIDKYKDDEEVLMEIETLIKAVDSNYTLLSNDTEVKEENYYPSQCNNECNSCKKCTQKVKEDELVQEVKEELLQNPMEEEVEEQKEFVPELLENSFLIVDKQGKAQITKLEELQFISNLHEYAIFALEEVFLEPVLTFKVHKKQKN